MDHAHVSVSVWLDSVKEILDQIGEGSSFKEIIQNLDSTSTLSFVQPTSFFLI